MLRSRSSKSKSTQRNDPASRQSTQSSLPALVNRYHLLDAKNLGELLPNRQFIDLTITSPPYWNLKNYGVKGQIGFGQSYAAYLNDIEQIFDQIYVRTKQTGALWLITDTFKQDGHLRLLPFDISARLAKSGWILQDVIIWQKDRTLPWSHQGKLRNIFEYVTLFTKSKSFKYNVSDVRAIDDIKYYWVQYPERYSPEGKTPSRAWSFPIPRQGSWGTASNYVRHACPLPIGLVERMLALSSDKGDLIFDPFAGSGTVLAVASSMKRRFLGTDINAKYRKLFHSTVYPSVSRRNATPDVESDTKVAFADTIGALRRLKYPREMIRLARRAGIDPQPRAILLSRSSANALSIGLVPAPGRSITLRTIARLDSLCTRPPLSKYGFKARIHKVALDDMSMLRSLEDYDSRSPSQYYCYSNGRFYFWERCIKTPQLPQAIRDVRTEGDKFPLIVSILGLRIDLAKPEESLGIINGTKAQKKKETSRSRVA